VGLGVCAEAGDAIAASDNATARQTSIALASLLAAISFPVTCGGRNEPRMDAISESNGVGETQKVLVQSYRFAPRSAGGSIRDGLILRAFAAHCASAATGGF
jgi:hypothetical protein